MTATDTLLHLDTRLTCRPFERSPEKKPYHWFDLVTEPAIHFPEGIEAEVGEFLYGLIRMARPKYILETGTRIGISTRYMALAMQDNDIEGFIVSFERDKFCADIAIEGIRRSKLYKRVTVVAEESLYFQPGQKMFDMLYLDSEPEYRYQELEQFWPNLNPGGLVVIHDLATLDDRAFGGCPLGVQAYIQRGLLRAFTFPTCSGFTVMQRAYENDYQLKIMER